MTCQNWIPGLGTELEARELRGGKLTRNDPRNPKTLRTLAKCRYHLKLPARWNGSSGSWEKSTLEMTFDASVARATSRVIVLGEEVSIARILFPYSGNIFCCRNRIGYEWRRSEEVFDETRTSTRPSPAAAPRAAVAVTYLDLPRPMAAVGLASGRQRGSCCPLECLPSSQTIVSASDGWW